MRLFRWLIAKAALLALVFSVSLSGYGMAQAHSAMMSDAPSMDHAAHAHMDHAGHDMTSADPDPTHEGHANCPMIACCHVAEANATVVPALSEAIRCQHVHAARQQLDKAEPEGAKKPPKHV